MKTVITLISLLVNLYIIEAQNNIANVMLEIEKNNSTLTALRKKTDADLLGNRTGIFMNNPEIEFSYLWGNPTFIGNRTDFSIRQSFDFPTTYSFKSKIADLQNQQLELEFQKQMKNVLFQARLLCVEIITANTLKKEYDKRLHHAQTITDSFKERFNKGDVNVIEFNKAQLLLLNAINESEINENNRKAFLAELAALNGGIPIALDDTMFVSSVLPSDFEQWYIETEKNSPVLSWLRQEIEISQKNQKLNFALSLPRFSAGYMSEKVVGQQFQGLSVGISIPLFENKNSVKHAKANVLAMQAMEKDYQITFYNKLKALHNRAIGLQKTLEKFRNAIQTIDNSEYLKTALDKGEISLIEYLMEISLYYTSVINMIETEKELQKTIAELAMFQ